MAGLLLVLAVSAALVVLADLLLMHRPLRLPAVFGTPGKASGVQPGAIPGARLGAAGKAGYASQLGEMGPAGDTAPYIQLVAVQMRWSLEDYSTPERFAKKVDSLLDDAARRLDPRYPALVVFPEDAGILTVFTGLGLDMTGITTFETAVERVVRTSLPAVIIERLRHGTGWVRSIFLARHREMARIYLETFSQAARKHRVYLVAGSIPLPDLASDGPGDRIRTLGTDIFNVSYLFGPDGRVIGWQKKVNLIDMEGPAALDLTPGLADELRVFDTPLGRVGIAICLDAFKEDVLRRLQEQGAEILAQPSANPAPWTPEQQKDWLNGAWRAVAAEKRFIYGVNPMMVGRVLDLGFYGQSSIVAREEGAGGAAGSVAGGGRAGYQATGVREGFLAVAGTPEGEEVLVVKVPHPRVASKLKAGLLGGHLPVNPVVGSQGR